MNEMNKVLLFCELQVELWETSCVQIQTGFVCFITVDVWMLWVLVWIRKLQHKLSWSITSLIGLLSAVDHFITCVNKVSLSSLGDSKGWTSRHSQKSEKQQEENWITQSPYLLIHWTPNRKQTQLLNNKMLNVKHQNTIRVSQCLISNH